ncbi:MAG TPA: hypothetical protein VF548_13150 [Allosphingosinicella sp.]|jgi:hypothetical protein
MSSEGDRQELTDEQPTATAHAGKDDRAATHVYINHLIEGQEHDSEAYLFKLAGRDVQRAVEEAMPMIERGERPVAGSPRNIKWIHRSYMVFVLKSSEERLDSVDFKLNGTGGNHTFIDETTLADFSDYTGVYYLNDRKNQHGQPLGPNESEKYRWHSRHSHRNGSRSDRSHENSGTNVGP